ncbi:MAG: helix-turn-helix transcriptional regulator [Bacteroidales bacterium]|nr:helix-turn-helix transcriptional regulator [Bacteroidales bacterium]
MEEIKDRLAHILRAKNMTATQFAELMEIQPSNVSHLLNGRNKPSLDFLIKLKEVFPEYSFDWIIMGKKPITVNEPNPISFDENNMRFDDVVDDNVSEFEKLGEQSHEVLDTLEKKIVENQIYNNKESDITKIILVYSDKTFEILNPKK